MGNGALRSLRGLAGCSSQLLKGPPSARTVVAGPRDANFKEVPARGEHLEGRGWEWRNPAHGGMLGRGSQPQGGRGSCFKGNFRLGVGGGASLWKVGDSLEAGPFQERTVGLNS